MWASLVTVVLSIFNNLTSIWAEKSKDKSLTENQKAKKAQAKKDEINDIIVEAHKTKNLEDIRKEASE